MAAATFKTHAEISAALSWKGENLPSMAVLITLFSSETETMQFMLSLVTFFSLDAEKRVGGIFGRAVL